MTTDAKQVFFSGAQSQIHQQINKMHQRLQAQLFSTRAYSLFYLSFWYSTDNCNVTRQYTLYRELHWGTTGGA